MAAGTLIDRWTGVNLLILIKCNHYHHCHDHADDQLCNDKDEINNDGGKVTGCRISGQVQPIASPLNILMCHESTLPCTPCSIDV